MKRRDVGSERRMERERERAGRVGDEGALPVGSVEKGDRGGYGVVVVVVAMVWVRGSTGSSEGREGTRGERIEGTRGVSDERSRGMERDERWEMEGSLGDRPREETNTSTEVGGEKEGYPDARETV